MVLDKKIMSVFIANNIIIDFFQSMSRQMLNKMSDCKGLQDNVRFVSFRT